MITPPDDVPARRAGRPRLASIRLASWTAFLGLALGALHLLGQGSLAPPPVAHPGDLPDWLAQRSSVAVAFCALRLAAMGLAWYLLGTTAVGLLARLAGWAGAVAAVDAVSLPVVRHVVGSAAGLAVAATISSAAGTAWALPGRPVDLASAVTAPAGSPTPIMRRLPDEAGRTTPGSVTPPSQLTPPDIRTARSSPPAAQPAPPSTWLVGPGDNLWSVADATLARAWGRAPSDAEVDRYWTELIALNRARLADPDNPDLVFPGQVFELLPSGPSPGGP